MGFLRDVVVELEEEVARCKLHEASGVRAGSASAGKAPLPCDGWLIAGSACHVDSWSQLLRGCAQPALAGERMLAAISLALVAVTIHFRQSSRCSRRKKFCKR